MTEKLYRAVNKTRGTSSAPASLMLATAAAAQMNHNARGRGVHAEIVIEEVRDEPVQTAPLVSSPTV